MKKIYPFRRIVFDCKQATLLSIKKAEGKISLFERLKLSYHLLYCDPCRQFIKQWNRLDQIQRSTGPAPMETAFTLSVASKDRMQQEIKKIEGSL